MNADATSTTKGRTMKAKAVEGHCWDIERHSEKITGTTVNTRMSKALFNNKEKISAHLDGTVPL